MCKLAVNVQGGEPTDEKSVTEFGGESGMSVRSDECGPECLEEYATLSIAFQVESVLRVEQVDGGLGGLLLHQELVAEPYLRDYEDDEEEPVTRWRTRFDLSNWGFFLARDGEKAVGGATIAYHTPNVWRLDGRTDLACSVGLADSAGVPGARGREGAVRPRGWSGRGRGGARS